ncbi:hypothetical protein KFZ70_03180 [Tamlana fucoidanivorans]|uniref:Transporter n=1 Tax=Allotamlana fucoidanivorans TaxID=2583814 RepID=A0A5C4SKD3_9FLAO|nr:hypothetical protein [Tamlana fucoidanivorans]TNJ44299.1 hypothetical protein FGF67_09740 [Tamlana fucoidanivorans]
MKKIILFAILIALSAQTIAQNEDRILEDEIIQVEEGKFTYDMSFAFKTMNVFRGLTPSKTPVLATQAGVKYGDFILGFYGGVNTNSAYQETDLILIYYRPKFNLRLDWYYNFTEGITNIPTASGFFDFNPETTRGLLDFMASFKLSNHFSLLSSTFLFGRDRPSLPEDDANDILLRRGEQRYTQYFNVTYSKKAGDYKIEAHIGYSFSWNDLSGPTFYSSKAGFNDIGVSLKRNLVDTDKITIPIKASMVVNPLSDNVYLVATIQLVDITRF